MALAPRMDRLARFHLIELSSFLPFSFELPPLANYMSYALEATSLDGPLNRFMGQLAPTALCPDNEILLQVTNSHV
jgi:hypothetical protein